MSTLTSELIARLPSLSADNAAAITSPAASFGELALPWQSIAARLNGEDATAFRAFVVSGTRLSKALGDRVGELVLKWAQSHGATHYAHWFQPLTGTPAEKHDAFLSVHATGPDSKPSAIEEFRGAVLLQGEPDASSFPSGGLRATHTARGYTVWDPQTPLFVRKDNGGCTLMIPCAFVSYKGHALDHKLPLLRAASALSKAATSFVSLLPGTLSVTRVTATLGTEQEYFLIDRKHVERRPDLAMAGRTLLGAAPPRGQQLEDHYFGVVPSRIQAYMAEVESELFKLGVPAKTRHNEVAPSQFELAPIFEEVSVACDHNTLTMETLRRVALRHGLVCLLHEKPFAGLNGSGKHNNWSMSTDTGVNLLDPGDTPEDNLRFVAVLAAVLLAVHRHADVLRASIASSGNDHRLGANEAPPSIISAYLGEAVDALATAAEGDGPLAMRGGELRAITDRLTVKLDPTDRNRTAPFAFTGNKFEYRAVGSNENCGWPMTILNAAVADVMAELAAKLAPRIETEGREAAIRGLVKEVLIETKATRFEGNGYGDEWRAEAARRGLGNHADTPAALAILTVPAATAFLTRQGVLDAEEVASRYEIFAERYVKLVEIEAMTLADIATTQVLAAVEQQASRSAEALRAFGERGASRSEHQRARVDVLLELIERIQAASNGLLGALGGLHHGGDAKTAMAHAAREVLPALATLRAACDEAETVVADALWPLPKYREILFPVA